MVSIIKLPNLQRKELQLLKPYIFNTEIINKTDTLPYLEFKDLKDLKKASIKELIVNKCFPSINLSKLLKNTNIKKIKLQNEYREEITIKWLLYISRLLRNNVSIKEIELVFVLDKNKISYFKKLAFCAFLNTASSRLVKIRNMPFPEEYQDINILIYNNSNLKDISFEINSGNKNIIKHILSSKKNLDEFIITDNYIKDIDQEFFDCISKSEAKAEINTLNISTKSSKEFFFFIYNAYLFKIETIKINTSKFHNEEEIFTHILELSNNPHNTVKRIIITSYYLNYREIISKLLNSKKYSNTQKIPKIFIEDFNELKLDIINNNTSKINRLYNGKSNFSLTFKDNSFDVDSFIELLYVLFNCPDKLRCLHLKYEDSKIENTETPKINENKDSLVSQMKGIFNKFKDNIVYSDNMTIGNLKLTIDQKYPILNIFIFTILEILIQMKISITELTLERCSVLELEAFMNKNKKQESLNISSIYLTISKLDLEHIDKLAQYSHLLKGNINLTFDNKIDLIEEDYFNVYSKLAKTTNFIHLYQKNLPFLNLNENNQTSFDSAVNMSSFIDRIKNSYKITGENNIIYNQIRCCTFDTLNLDLLYKIFSVFKEYKCSLNEISFTKIKPVYVL